MDRCATYREAIRRRRAFCLPGYASLAEAGVEGPWVSPIQVACGSLTGPMIVSKDYCDAPTAVSHAAAIRRTGLVPGMGFTAVLDRMLALLGLARSDIYVTPIFKLLPPRRSHALRSSEARASFDAVTRFEILGRTPVAAGTDAARTLSHFGVAHVAAPHPSARGLSHAARARSLADAVEAVA